MFEVSFFFKISIQYKVEKHCFTDASKTVTQFRNNKIITQIKSINSNMNIPILCNQIYIYLMSYIEVKKRGSHIKKNPEIWHKIVFFLGKNWCKLLLEFYHMLNMPKYIDTCSNIKILLKTVFEKNMNIL